MDTIDNQDVAERPKSFRFPTLFSARIVAYGFKLHLVINNLGDMVNFMASSANVSDNNTTVLNYLL
ncbi:MAG: hypothetical protein J5I94_15775 [Phaeodactylibacter sp.]|nr:hypothetical protein [Phaeodactylibacter sp.]